MTMARNSNNNHEVKDPFFMLGISNITRGPLSDLLSNKDLITMSLASKNTMKLFAEPLAKRRLQAFQETVTRRELVKAINMLQLHPEYLISKGVFFDYAGRRFEGVSAFEYLLWADDASAISQMLLAIPQPVLLQKLTRYLHEQRLHVEANGVTYTHNKQKITEPHYDASLHIQAFKQLKLNFNSWDAAQKKEFCMNIISDIQSCVPVHVAEAICATAVNRNTLVIKLLDVNLSEQQWYPLHEAGKGHGFAILRGDDRAVMTNYPLLSMVDNTIALLETLQASVLEDRRNIKLRLDMDFELIKYTLEHEDMPEDPQNDVAVRGKCCVIC